ncbi:hypothetical protein, partial [Pseudoalteromonas sp. MER144-MNA-CIBAN-0113]
DYTYNPVNRLIDVDTNVYQSKTQILRDSDYIKNPGFEFDAEVKTTGAKVQNTSLIDSSVFAGVPGTHKLIAGVEHYKKESDYN